MIMGKGKHSEWQKVRVNKLYEDDYDPSNKVIRKRIKEIKMILEERNKNIFYRYRPLK